MDKVVKLSKVQKDIVHLLNTGWSMGKSEGMHSRVWLQFGKVGHGGDTKKLSFATFGTLYRNGIIEVTKKDYPTSTYSLTSLGKSIDL